ncbi:MAG: hypothetical protein QXO03_00350 [Thermoplasmatales archaeon]
MNKTVTIAIIVILVAVAGGLAYGYGSASVSLASENFKVSNLTTRINQEQQNISSLNSELLSYQNNSKLLSAELKNATYYSVLQSAYSHWDYISIENQSLLASQYLSNATLTWIGGPLSGNYTGISAIEGTWSKFFNLWSAVWFYTPSPPSIIMQGSNYVVNSRVQFVVTPSKEPMQVQFLNISYSLEYVKSGNLWLIQHEGWYIVSTGLISYSASEVGTLTEGTVLNYAFSHWNSIAIENVSGILSQYSNQAKLNWIGGPLSGTYNYSQIPTVWKKFTGLWSAVWFYTESPPTISSSPNGYFINATVQWVLTPVSAQMQVNDIVTNYSLEYRINQTPQIVSETWHIISASTISYSAGSVESLQAQSIENAAFTHWNDIAIENVSLVMKQYSNNSTLQWIGGKLAGNYANSTEIEHTWEKFFGLWSAMWFYSEAPPVVNVTVSNGMITQGVVTADVQFVVQNALNSSQFSYIDVVYTIHFSLENGGYLITYETFDNVKSGPLSQATTFS